MSRLGLQERAELLPGGLRLNLEDRKELHEESLEFSDKRSVVTRPGRE